MPFYKETDFQDSIIGKYPKDWAIARIDEKFDTSSGGTPDRQRKEYYKGTIPWVKSGELKDKVILETEEKITEDGFKNSAAKLFPKGTLLVAMYGATVGKTGILGIDATTNQAVCALLPKEKDVDITYLKHSLVSIRNRWIFQSAGGAQPNISQDIIRSSRLPFPPYKEQKQIAEVLGVVDSAIALADRIIAKTERLKRGLMQQLLTHGIGHTETKQTPIGQIPKEWETMKLGDVLEQCQYGLSVKFGEEGKYPILKMDDIVNGVTVPDKVKRVDLDNHIFSDFKLEKGDVLFNRTNSYEHVGRTGIFLLDGDYTFASYLIRLRPKKELIDSQFLTFYLIYSSDRLKQLATRAAHQANINATNLQSFPIVLPPLSEQKNIAQIILTLDQKLGLENKERARLEQIKKGLMDLLLTGKIRIKVD